MSKSNIKNRGFGSMTPEKQREIASRGGRTVHAMGLAHHWTSETARAAGKKGGAISKRRRQEKRVPPPDTGTGTGKA